MNLVEMFTQGVPGGLIEKLGAAAGMSPDASQQVFKQSSPVLGYGLADAGATEVGAQKLLDVARDNQAEGLVDHFDTFMGSTEGRTGIMNKGAGLLSHLFGGKLDGIIQALSQGTQTSITGTQSMLAMLAPLALGMLSRHARSQNMDARGLSSFLGGQRSTLAGMLPFGLGTLLGAGGGAARTPTLRDVSQTAPESGMPLEPVRTPETISRPEIARPEPIPRPRVAQPQQRSIAGPLLLLAAGIALIGWLFSNRHRRAEEQTATSAYNEPRSAEPTPSYGVTPPAQGVDALASYAGEQGNVTTPRRFELGDIGFQKGAAALAPGSAASVDKLAQVLKEHSGMRIEIMGHTDAAGAAANNSDLPLARADALKSELVGKGIGADRIDTAASAQPLASDRGVDVIVLEK
jgi:outer membrane protein OmpA-like peptidoglycan-associated protein